MKARYLVPQIVVLGWWLLDWVIFGTPGYWSRDIDGLPVSVLQSFVMLFPLPTLLVTVAVGIVDGAGDREDEAFITVLVVSLALLIAIFGLGLPELLESGNALPADLRLALLIAMESLLVLEWGIAALLRLVRRLVSNA